MPLTSTGRKIQPNGFTSRWSQRLADNPACIPPSSPTHKTNHSSIYSTDLEQSSLWLEVKSWKNASDWHGEKNSNSLPRRQDAARRVDRSNDYNDYERADRGRDDYREFEANLRVIFKIWQTGLKQSFASRTFFATLPPLLLRPELQTTERWGF